MSGAYIRIRQRVGGDAWGETWYPPLLKVYVDVKALLIIDY